MKEQKDVRHLNFVLEVQDMRNQAGYEARAMRRSNVEPLHLLISAMHISDLRIVYETHGITVQRARDVARFVLDKPSYRSASSPSLKFHTQAVFERAQKVAQARKADIVQPVDVALALVDDESSTSSRLLEAISPTGSTREKVIRGLYLASKFPQAIREMIEHNYAGTSTPIERKQFISLQRKLG